MSLDSLLAEGKRNQIKAHDTYEGRALRVSGVVEHRGLQGFGGYVAHGGLMTGIAFSRERETLAYALLVPDEPSLGRLLCYFEPDERAKVGDLEPGQRVKVFGLFNRFRKEPVGLVVQLDSCDVER